MAENEVNDNVVFSDVLKAALMADEAYPVAFDMKRVNGHVADGTLYVQDSDGKQYKVAIKVERLDEI